MSESKAQAPHKNEGRGEFAEQEQNKAGETFEENLDKAASVPMVKARYKPSETSGARLIAPPLSNERPSDTTKAQAPSEGALRAAFEKWALGQPGANFENDREIKRDDLGNYIYTDVQHAWKAWKAADRHWASEKRVLVEALELGLKIAESWAHDQLDGTCHLQDALAELEPIRVALKTARESK